MKEQLAGRLSPAQLARLYDKHKLLHEVGWWIKNYEFWRDHPEGKDADKHRAFSADRIWRYHEALRMKDGET